jgi:hypothetical protein
VVRATLPLRESFYIIVSYTSISGSRIFSEFLWVALAGIKLKTFDELRFGTDNLGSIGPYRNSL